MDGGQIFAEAGFESPEVETQVAVEHLGEGVQKQRDRLAYGTQGAVTFVVVVGHEPELSVLVAVRRSGR
ncbi:hypothetical protein ACT3SQ_18940 [Brachybacterium sp. AOP42-C2-15]|uniref:hypothetical protein n=1 Tax=unclassified Brachybacterium TaxID=2623841 RepID=UPI003FB942AB